MRVDNWESKLNAVIHDTIHNKGDYILGKNDCGLFVVSCIESIIGKKVFDGKYKTFNQLKKIFKQLKSKNLLNLALNIAKEHNFKTIDISKVQRGDILYYVDKTDLDGTLGVCIGSTTMFNWKKGISLMSNDKCEIAWRIE